MQLCNFVCVRWNEQLQNTWPFWFCFHLAAFFVVVVQLLKMHYCCIFSRHLKIWARVPFLLLCLNERFICTLKEHSLLLVMCCFLIRIYAFKLDVGLVMRKERSLLKLIIFPLKIFAWMFSRQQLMSDYVREKHHFYSNIIHLL